MLLMFLLGKKFKVKKLLCVLKIHIKQIILLTVF